MTASALPSWSPERSPSSPPRRWLERDPDRRRPDLIATARLEHFAAVTFTADPAALAALLPDGVEVDLPLVSAVAYRYVDLGPDGMAGPRLSAEQVHLRAYVRVGDERGVWFLRTVQDSRWAPLPRLVWGMPWRRGTVDISESTPGGVRVAANGIALEVNAGAAPDDDLPREVTAATVGWFQGRRGVLRFKVSFDNLDVVRYTASEAAVAPFEALGLVQRGQPPESAFRHADTNIQIHLPPRSAFSRP